MKKILLLLLVFINCYSVNSQISDDGLIAYYPLNGDVMDHSINNFDGVSHGGSYVDDQYGNFSALQLNGLNEFVDLSIFASNFRANMGEMTIVFDILFEKEDADQTILSLGKVGDDLESNVFEIEYEHNRLQVETETGNEATNHEFPIDETQYLFDKKWHRIAITLKNNILTYCRDGKMIYKGEYVPAETNTEKFYLGQFSGGTSAWNYALGATIDELQFYDRILSDEEICGSNFEQNCEGEYVVDLDKNLLLHFDLNNNAIDDSGNDFNGTMIDVSGIEDRFGNENGAIHFNGSSSFIFPENDDLQPQFPISISVWAYFEKEEKFTNAIINTNFVENNYHGIFLYRIFEGGNISISYGGGLGITAPENRRTASTKKGVPIQEWVHIVGIISGPEEFQIYINGCNQSLDYSGYGPTEIAYNEHPGQLGLHDSNMLPEYPNHTLVGALDDFYFWDRTISEEEVLSLYDRYHTKEINIEEEYTIIDETPLQITLDTNYTDVVWSNGEMGNEISIDEAGSYSVEAYDNCILVCKSFVVTEIDFEQNCDGIYNVDLDENLLLHYNLNNNAIDDSGNDFNGTMIDILGVEDRFGNENGAIYFNGSSNFVFPEKDELQPQFPISISVWTYFEKEEQFTQAIVSTNFVENNYHGIMMSRFFESGNIGISYGGGLGNTGPNNRRSASTKNGVPIQEWVHIVGIISGPEEFGIYINGCLQELTYSGYGPTEIAYNENPGQLGLLDSNTLPEYPNNTLVGSLDDFYFWDRTITEEEVLYLYDRYYSKEINIEEEYIITDEIPLQITLDTNYTDVAWSNGEMGNEISIDEAGSYSVEAYYNCILVCADFEVKVDEQNDDCEIILPVYSGCNKNKYECVLSEENGGYKYLYEGHFQISEGYKLCGTMSSSVRFNHGEIEIVDYDKHIHQDGAEWISYTSFIYIDDIELFEFEDSYISFEFCSINVTDDNKCISYFLPYKACNNSYECIVQNHGVSANNDEYIDVNYCLNLHEVVQDDCVVDYFEIEAIIYGDDNSKSIYNETLYGDFSSSRCIKIPILISDFLGRQYNCIELFINGDCPEISCAHLDCNLFYKSSYKGIVENESTIGGNIGSLSSYDNQKIKRIENINIYPNPAVEQLNINFESSGKEGSSNIVLRNLFNQKCIAKSFVGDNISLNISELKTGIYYVSILNNGVAIANKRIIKIE